VDFISPTTEKGRFQSRCMQHSTIWPTGARWASWRANRPWITSPCRCFMAVTPEAPSELPEQKFVISEKEIRSVYAGYGLGDGEARLVVFSGPQQSLPEMKRLAQLFGGRKLKAGSSCFVTTNGAVLARSRSLGYAKVLEAAGVTILEGVCFYILQNLSLLRRANRWSNMVSNSAKIVNIIGAHRFNTILRRTADCVEIACSGELR